MSAYANIRLTSISTSAPVAVAPPTQATWQASPAWKLGLICTLSAGGSATYSVQVTADPVPSANGNWNDHDVLVAQTASANSNIDYPVTGVRLKITSFTGGSVTLGIAQWP